VWELRRVARPELSDRGAPQRPVTGEAARLAQALQQAEDLRLKGRDEDALELVARLRETAGPEASAEWRRQALFLEADIAFGRAELDRSERCLRELHGLRAAAAGAGAPVSPEDHMLVERWVALGWFEEALSLGRQALEAYTAEGHHWRMGVTRLVLAIAYCRLGDSAGARSVLGDDAEAPAPMQMRRWFTQGLLDEAECRSARTSFTRAAELARQCESPAEVRWRILAHRLLHLPIDEAVAEAEALWRTAEGVARPAHGLHIRLCVAGALCRGGRVQAAADHAQALMQWLAGPPVTSYATADTWWQLQHLLSADGRRPEAAEAARRAHAWMARTLPHVPAAFHDRFVRRHESLSHPRFTPPEGAARH
jgi:tetratricopeptide (TPR) repeat protein